jgi:hypothetical protein
LVERQATTQADIERVFHSLNQAGVDGIFVLSHTLNVKFPSLLVRLTFEKRLPFAGYRFCWHVHVLQLTSVCKVKVVQQIHS